MKEVKLGCKLVAVLIFITLVLHLDIIITPVKLVYHLRSYERFTIFLIIISWLFFFVNLFAAIGLFRQRRWGFGAAYVAIVFSTFTYGVSYIPLFDALFPSKYAPFATLMANIGVLTLLISLQMMTFEPKKKSRRKSKK
jgi:hypothetical protein